MVDKKAFEQTFETISRFVEAEVRLMQDSQQNDYISTLRLVFNQLGTGRRLLKAAAQSAEITLQSGWFNNLDALMGVAEQQGLGGSDAYTSLQKNIAVCKSWNEQAQAENVHSPLGLVRLARRHRPV